MSESKPKDFVKEKFTEYLAAYSKMKNPSQKHIKDYNDLSSNYNKYIEREVINEKNPLNI